MSNLLGDRGENIFELAVTNYEYFNGPIFNPAFLGDKWPAVDYYVELLGVEGSSPFFLAQVKTTADPIVAATTAMAVSVTKEKCSRLFNIPGPTYLIGVHEPTKRVFVLSVHEKPAKGTYRIPIANELTPENLRILYDEVAGFWKAFPNKPMESYFL